MNDGSGYFLYHSIGQYPGKAGFGLMLGKVNGLPNPKIEVWQRCWQMPNWASRLNQPLSS